MKMFETVNDAISLENFLYMKKILEYPTADHVLIAANNEGKFLHVCVATGRPGPNEIAIFTDRIKNSILEGNVRVEGETVEDVDNYVFVVEVFIDLLNKIDNFIKENENV